MTASPDDRTAQVDETEIAPQKASAKRAPTEKQAPEAATASEKSTRTPVEKKPVEKKPVAKKPVAKKPSAARAPAKAAAAKPTASRTPAVRTSAAKAAAEKAAPTAEIVVEPLKKALSDQPAQKRTAAAARSAATKNTAARAAATKSVPSTTAKTTAAKTTAAKTTAAKTTAAKTTAAKTTAAKTAAAKTAAAKAAAAKSTAAKSTARAATAKTAAAKTAAAKAAATKAAAAKAAEAEAAKTESETVSIAAPVSVPEPVPVESVPVESGAVESAPVESAPVESVPAAVEPTPVVESIPTEETIPATESLSLSEVDAPTATGGETSSPEVEVAEVVLVEESDSVVEVEVVEVVAAVEEPDDSGSDAAGPVDGPSIGEAISIRGLVKHFGDNRAVDGIDLTVPAGSFYGVVGPNGAGKTTTLSIVAGLLRADEGRVVICGIDQAAQPQAAKRLMGVLPDRLRTFDRLTGRQLLYYYGLLRGLAADVIEKRASDLARAFDLGDALSRVVSDYSAGMTKKIMLAGAMIHSPRVLVLDEPFESVDPVSSAVILDILRAYVSHGGTVILSSHGMDLVERVCSRVAIIVNGEVLAEGTIDEVRAGQTLEARFVELAGSSGEVEGLEWLHTFSD